jgi:hypothetical protein
VNSLLPIFNLVSFGYIISNKVSWKIRPLHSALNANEVRAIRQYPLNQEYRVVGIATDINVTYGDAIVIIKSDVDLWNGCSAEMVSFDDAEVINIGDNIDLFCSSWKEVAGNVSFKKCRPYIKMISN